MKIMFVGDINLGEYYTGFGHGPLSYVLGSSKSVFDKVAPIFARADLVVGNLEAPITRNNHDPKNPECCVLKVDPDVAHQLSDAGIKLVQVANNHTVQHGQVGFDDTLGVLQSLGIQYAGCHQQGPQVVTSGSQRLAFFAASDVPDNTDKQQSQYQRLDEEFVQRVENAVPDFDHIIVMLHWGLEASTGPLPYQREMAARLEAAGVRAIVGSHPHLFYPIEAGENFVCAYSLGNFVFDLCWDSRLLKTGILEIDFSGKQLQSRFWPVIIERDGCLPTPAGDAIDLSSAYTHYNLGADMSWQQVKKNVNFWSNIGKGNTRLKLRFFANKIFRVLGINTGVST